MAQIDRVKTKVLGLDNRSPIGLIGVALLALLGGWVVYLLLQGFLGRVVDNALETGNLFLTFAILCVVYHMPTNAIMATGLVRFTALSNYKVTPVDLIIPIWGDYKITKLYFNSAIPMYIEDKRGNLPKNSSNLKATLAKVLGYATFFMGLLTFAMYVLGIGYLTIRYGSWSMRTPHEKWIFTMCILTFIMITLRSLEVCVIIWRFKSKYRCKSPKYYIINLLVLPTFFVLNLLYVIISVVFNLHITLPLFNILGFILLPLVQPLVIWTMTAGSSSDAKTQFALAGKNII